MPCGKASPTARASTSCTASTASRPNAPSPRARPITPTPLPRPSRGITFSRRNSTPKRAASRASRSSATSPNGIPRDLPHAMLIIPAIDLKDGACVRLEQGRMDKATVFSKEPGKTASQWASKGARRIHVVDLNGAFAGKPRNEAAIKQIIGSVDADVPVQLGGGIRDLDTIERYLDDG